MQTGIYLLISSSICFRRKPLANLNFTQAGR
jgi:hypothetical protein